MTQNNSLCLLIAKAEQIASQKYDGHLTILRFTTGYKVGFGTPCLYLGASEPSSAYNQLLKLPAFGTLEAALNWLISEGVNFYDF